MVALLLRWACCGRARHGVVLLSACLFAALAASVYVSQPASQPCASPHPSHLLTSLLPAHPPRAGATSQGSSGCGLACGSGAWAPPCSTPPSSAWQPTTCGAGKRCFKFCFGFALRFALPMQKSVGLCVCFVGVVSLPGSQLCAPQASDAGASIHQPRTLVLLLL